MRQDLHVPISRNAIRRGSHKKKVTRLHEEACLDGPPPSASPSMTGALLQLSLARSPALVALLIKTAVPRGGMVPEHAEICLHIALTDRNPNRENTPPLCNSMAMVLPLKDVPTTTPLAQALPCLSTAACLTVVFLTTPSGFLLWALPCLSTGPRLTVGLIFSVLAQRGGGGGRIRLRVLCSFIMVACAVKHAHAPAVSIAIDNT